MRRRGKDIICHCAYASADIAFRKKELNTWLGIFPEARVARYPEAGHFVPEEEATSLVEEIRSLIANQ